NRGTVCGSLAHADPAAELPALALATGAELVARSSTGERVIPAADFFVGYLTSALDETELLTAVRFPPWPPSTGWSVQEVSRRHGDYALVGLAAVVALDAGGRVERAALSFFGAGATPVRVGEAERVLAGHPAGAAAFAEAAAVVTATIDPPGDNHATAAYRAHVAGVLTRRCLAEAADRARAGGGARPPPPVDDRQRAAGRPRRREPPHPGRGAAGGPRPDRHPSGLRARRLRRLHRGPRRLGRPLLPDAGAPGRRLLGGHRRIALPRRRRPQPAPAGHGRLPLLPVRLLRSRLPHDRALPAGRA